VIPIHVPPLRERREDIMPLVEHYMSRLAARTGKAIRELSPAALTALYDYDYPGNVRELSNALERAFVLCHGEEIDLFHLPPEMAAVAGGGVTQQEDHHDGTRLNLSAEIAGETAATSGDPAGANPWRLKPSEHKLLSSPGGRRDEVSYRSARSFEPGRVRPEVRRLLDVLDAHRWNRGATATALGISRSTLWRRMKEYELV
jgi:DNA-binding NtrC family response regulator